MKLGHNAVTHQVIHSMSVVTHDSVKLSQATSQALIHRLEMIIGEVSSRHQLGIQEQQAYPSELQHQAVASEILGCVGCGAAYCTLVATNGVPFISICTKRNVSITIGGFKHLSR